MLFLRYEKTCGHVTAISSCQGPLAPSRERKRLPISCATLLAKHHTFQTCLLPGDLRHKVTSPPADRLQILCARRQPLQGEVGDFIPGRTGYSSPLCRMGSPWNTAGDVAASPRIGQSGESGSDFESDFENVQRVSRAIGRQQMFRIGLAT